MNPNICAICPEPKTELVEKYTTKEEAKETGMKLRT